MKYGTEFDATGKRRASGTSHNAAKRGYANYFDLTTQGGTAEGLLVAQIGPGCVVDQVTIEASGNLAAINFSLGTPDAPAKYGAAAAGPNASGQVRYPPLATKLDATADKEELILTPSAALPSTGTIRVKVTATHR